ncbi:hypothetical protein [Streptomyces chattanoogensis]|uniref:Lipoprotein n=1 Tax=Streptomyces chattanoogensis TaxID=66876 RepID=A0A0N1JVK1_9ACTN|nr:hypothetical protein [Streptomyces chattanoogensis]KPC58874.1 hypothetical protein ADL29_37480 [Streptomyces chattanoogensis]
MFPRRLLAAAAVAAALATLTSCKGEDDAKADAPESSASPVPAKSRTADPSAAPSASASASASSQASPPSDPAPGTGEPTFDCTPRKLAKGHRMVQITGAPSGGALLAKEAKFACDPNGGGYAGTGKAARFRLASGATAELAIGAVDHRKVTVAQLTEHVNACLKHEPVKQPLMCSGDIYELTVTGSGDVSHVSEVWHP